MLSHLLPGPFVFLRIHIRPLGEPACIGSGLVIGPPDDRGLIRLLTCWGWLGAWGCRLCHDLHYLLPLRSHCAGMLPGHLAGSRRSWRVWCIRATRINGRIASVASIPRCVL